MNGNGSGSIDVTAGDDTWQYEWPELNDSVKTTVSNIFFSYRPDHNSQVSFVTNSFEILV